VILVTRLNGTEVVVNADLIETVEAAEGTLITLVDGKQYVVRETTDEVVARIRSFRAAIVRGTDDPAPQPSAQLYVLPD
jgi:flagellar protein FlbD